MSKFQVKVQQHGVRIQVSEIEADTEEEAKEKVLDRHVAAKLVSELFEPTDGRKTEVEECPDSDSNEPSKVTVTAPTKSSPKPKKKPET